MSTKAKAPVMALAKDKKNLEEGASWFSFVFLLYLDKLFATGYARTLEIEDLGDIAHCDKSDVLHKRFDVHLKKALATPVAPGKKRQLWPILWSTVGRWRLYLSVALFAFASALQFGPVMILKALVEYLQGTLDLSLTVVWVLVALLFIFPLASSLALAHSNAIMAHVGCQLRNVLIGVIYRKSLTLSSSSRQAVSTGRIVTMFSEDTNQIRMFTFLLANTVVAPLQIATCLYLLYAQVGVATFLGLAFILVTMPVNGVIFGWIASVRKIKMKHTDARVKLINEVLAGIRIIKYYAWEKAFIAKITLHRIDELKILETIGYVMGSVFAILMVGASQIQTLIIFYSFIAFGGQLDAATAFTTLTLFGQMTSPFIFLPYGLQQYSVSLVSTARIMEFLQTEDLEAYIKHHGREGEKVEAEGADGGQRVSENVIEMDGATLSWMSATEIEAAKGVEAEAKAREAAEAKGEEDKEGAVSVGDVELTNAEKAGDKGYAAVPASSAAAAVEGKAEAEAEAEGAMTNRHQYTLQDLTLKIKANSLVAVVGPVGCGKSSLLSAILGEMCCMGGSVSMYSGLSVAYCDQRPWIVNATVKDNILFGLPYDETRFNAAIYAACMTDDLKILSNGIMTEIGERGINMSGGQKARVALARAVYSNSDLLLLDDPLSAVDAHVGQHIFQKCIREALHGKTRILVTHHVNVLPMCDQVIVLEGGRVKMAGTYEEIMRSGIDIESFIPEPEEEDDAVEAEALAVVPEGGVVAPTAGGAGGAIQRAGSGGDSIDARERGSSLDDSGRIRSSSLSSSSTQRGRSRSRTRTTSGDKGGSEKVPKDDAGKLMTEEEKNEGDVALSSYVKLIRTGGVLVFTLCIACVVIAQILGIYANFWLVDWGMETTRDHFHGEDMSRKRNTFYLNGYASMLMVMVFINMVSRMVLNYHRDKSSKYLHAELLQKVLLAPVAFFDVTPIGRIVNRFSQDMAVIDELLAHSISQAISVGASCVGCIWAVIAATKGTFLAMVFPLTYIYMLFQKYYRASNTAIARIEAVTRSPIYADFSQVLGGTATIRAYQQQPRYIEQLEVYTNINTVPGVYQQIVAQWLAIRLDLIGATITLFMGVLAIATRSSNFIPAGNLALGLSYSISLTGLLKFAVRVIAGTEAQMNSIERVDHYVSTLTEEGEDVPDKAVALTGMKSKKAAKGPWYSSLTGSAPADDAAPAAADVEAPSTASEALARVPRVPVVAPPSDWPSEGRVQFEGVSMRYRDGPLVLKEVSFSVDGSEKIGVCGRTGCGKSSLMVALFRIEELTAGRILIDGIDIASVPLSTLRSKLCIIPQDPVMFSATVRFNLDPFNDFNDTELWDTLESVDMKAYVTSLPQKLEEMVSEGGENFSAGQRQLICMARALLRKPKILVMDEATASIDMETDALVQQMVRDKFKDCTVLTIAHRLDTIFDSDQIAVMSAGKLVEYGPSTELLKASLSEAGGVGTFKLLWTRHQQEHAGTGAPNSPITKK